MRFYHLFTAVVVAGVLSMLVMLCGIVWLSMPVFAARLLEVLR